MVTTALNGSARCVINILHLARPPPGVYTRFSVQEGVGGGRRYRFCLLAVDGLGRGRQERATLHLDNTLDRLQRLHQSLVWNIVLGRAALQPRPTRYPAPEVTIN